MHEIEGRIIQRTDLPGLAARTRLSLSRVVDLVRHQARSDHPPLRVPVDYFMARQGKLLRPILTLLACEVVGGEPEDAADFACAIELVHCASLIFDDLPCIDDARMRRGQASLHVRFGEGTAVLVGVHLLNRAFHTAATRDKEGGRAVAILSEAISPGGMVKGELLDLAGSGDNDDVRDLKTGALFRAAMHLGAYAGRADAVRVSALLAFATQISLALQLRDDVLDDDTPGATQQRATAYARDAGETVFAAFGPSEATSTLAALAVFAATRTG